MRKIILNLAVSLDGYIEGPNGEYDWCFTDQDYGMTDFLGSIDTLFVGRKSYELIAGSEDEMFPGIEIFVFSDTLHPADHPKVTVVNKAAFHETVKSVLEEEQGGNIWLFGGADLAGSFISQKLIGEFALSVHPVVLGGGKPLFQAISDRVELILTDTQVYSSGLVQLKYVFKPVFDYSLLNTKFKQSGHEDIDL
jgi:dihydrofolate reductase